MADYCVKKGGEVDTRLPYFNTNDDNQANAGIASDAGWKGEIQAEEEPLARLFVTVLQRFGVETDTFAGTTGTLKRV